MRCATLTIRSHFARQMSLLTGTATNLAGSINSGIVSNLDGSASKACLILLPLHDGDETYNSWKPLLNT
ncbi:MAG: hypothetical protein PUD20_00005, partial [bacterium]|nr:hypothetical protein [bacterium]